MRGTIEDCKKSLDEMKQIYPYDDSKTVMTNHNILTNGANDFLEISTIDESSGIVICMSKQIGR